jgi:hypothetical protein
MKALSKSPRSHPPRLAVIAAAVASIPVPATLSQEEHAAESPASTILPPVPTPATTLTTEQRAFFRDLALLNARQLSLANEASGRATRSATRDFAEWVRREHETFAEELATLAKVLGDEAVARAEMPPIKERPAWANRDDVGYDEGYLRATIELGERIAERLEGVSQSAEITVAALAQKQLPGLASRKQRARDLQQEL